MWALSCIELHCLCCICIMLHCIVTTRPLPTHDHSHDQSQIFRHCILHFFSGFKVLASSDCCCPQSAITLLECKSINEWPGCCLCSAALKKWLYWSWGGPEAGSDRQTNPFEICPISKDLALILSYTELGRLFWNKKSWKSQNFFPPPNKTGEN